MILNRITDAIEEPVTLAEVKQASRIDYGEEDIFINHLIKSARQFCEEELQLSLATETWQLKLDYWPCDGSPIELPRGPVQSVSSVKYIDVDGVEKTIDNSNYILDSASYVARLDNVDTYSWPSTQDRIAPITIEYVSGYTTAPEDIKHAIIMLVGHWFEHRIDATTMTIKQIPMGAQRILDLYRIRNV